MVSESIVIASIFAFFCVLAMLVVNNFYERKEANKREKDLLNRLMASDFRDYVTGDINLNAPQEAGPTPEEIAQAMREEDSEGYSHGGVPVI